MFTDDTNNTDGKIVLYEVLNLRSTKGYELTKVKYPRVSCSIRMFVKVRTS